MTPASATSPQTPPRPMYAHRLVLIFGCLLGIAANCYLRLPSLPLIFHGDNDFMGFYAGAELAGTPKLYDAAAITRAEQPLWERPRFLAFVRFPIYATLISPLAAFSYQHAYWIWQAVSLACVLLFIWLWPAEDRWMTALACCWSVPLLDCFIMGRDVPFFVLPLAGAVVLFLRGRHFAAGCVFSLCLIKYNYFLSVPILIVGRRLWKFGGGIAAGGAALLAASFVVGGWSWPLDYLATLRLPTTTPNYRGMPNLHGLLSGFPHGIGLELAASCLVLAAAWYVIRGPEITHAFAAMLFSGLLISYHGFFGDALVVLPAILFLLYPVSNPVYKALGIFLLTPLAYLPFLLPATPFPPATVIALPLLAMVAIRMRTSGLLHSLPVRLPG